MEGEKKPRDQTCFFYDHRSNWLCTQKRTRIYILLWDTMCDNNSCFFLFTLLIRIRNSPKYSEPDKERLLRHHLFLILSFFNLFFNLKVATGITILSVSNLWVYCILFYWCFMKYQMKWKYKVRVLSQCISLYLFLLLIQFLLSLFARFDSWFYTIILLRIYDIWKYAAYICTYIAICTRIKYCRNWYYMKSILFK